MPFRKLESGCGWIVYWLVRMGELLENFGTHEAPDLRAEPMEYFRNQCFIATEEEEGEDVAHVIARMGANKVLWGSDYPHPDSAFPRSVESFFGLRGISEEDKRKILWDNPAGLYDIGP
ncbi:MAG: amidohydrolase family protein [Dehalococcoidia bacterium]